MTQRLKLLILCGQSPRHLYVANALCRAGEPLAIVHESGRELTFASALRRLRPKLLIPKVWRWLRDRFRYANRDEAEFFFGSADPHLERQDLVRTVHHINDPQLVHWLDELRPDLVCVFGTSLIRGDLLRGGRLGIVNLHGGLSPEYRGADCTFWALHNGEPHNVGCTLHYINAGIDTGNLIAHVKPAVGPGDEELPLFWRAVKDSAQVYADFVTRVGHGEQFGQSQPGRGRLYQVKDRGLKQEQHLRRLLDSGLLADCRMPLRVVWFGSTGRPSEAATPALSLPGN